MPASANTRKPAATRRARAWVRLPDEELLKVRLCDLDLTVEDSRLARSMRRLYAELAGRGITFKPHAWLSEEWFSPDGVPRHCRTPSTWRIRVWSGLNGA